MDGYQVSFRGKSDNRRTKKKDERKTGQGERRRRKTTAKNLPSIQKKLSRLKPILVQLWRHELAMLRHFERTANGDKKELEKGS